MTEDGKQRLSELIVSLYPHFWDQTSNVEVGIANSKFLESDFQVCGPLTALLRLFSSVFICSLKESEAQKSK